LSLSYKVYGLRIVTNRPLPGLIIQPIATGTDVQICLKDSKSEFISASSIPIVDFHYVSSNSDEHAQPNLRVGMIEGGKYFGFFYSDGARFAIDRAGREVHADWPENYSLEDACTYLLGPIIAFVLRLRGVICLHASAIALNDRAILLFGVAGAGKSTTAAALALRGFSVLSDDVAVLTDLGDQFLVQPGYPRINLWPDSVRALFGSEDALPRITPTWGKRYLALDQNGLRFQSSPLPLGAIYILGEREAELTVPVIEKLVGREAIMTLVANTHVNYLLDLDMRAYEFDVLSRLVARVPLRRVRPTADASKIFSLCETITADATQLALSDATRADLGEDWQ
jgi:hypothetical protein